MLELVIWSTVLFCVDDFFSSSVVKIEKKSAFCPSQIGAKNDDGSAWERLLIAFCLAHTDGFWRQGPGPSRFEVY